MIKQRKITDYRPDPHNANRGTERGAGMIEDSFSYLGAGRSILVDKHGTIIAGNKSQEGAINAGLIDAIEVETDGRQLVVVRRTDLDLSDAKGKARKLAYADNRTSEVSYEIDVARLLEDIEGGLDLGDLFTDREIQLLAENAGLNLGELLPESAPLGMSAEALLAKWQVKPGDLWIVPGKGGHLHRILCGDSTHGENLLRALGDDKIDLIIADPPYGVDFKRSKYIAKPLKRNRRPIPDSIIGDDRKGADQQEFIRNAFLAAAPYIQPAAAVYAFSGSLAEGMYSMLGLIEAGIHLQSQLIWNKSHFAIGYADYKWKHEVCWYGWYKSKSKHQWHGGRDKSTVIDCASDPLAFHPHEKPIELLGFFINNSSREGDRIYDPFAGSGTTIAACEKLGRACSAIEIDPKFVSAALQRLEAAGLAPIRDHEG